MQLTTSFQVKKGFKGMCGICMKNLGEVPALLTFDTPIDFSDLGDDLPPMTGLKCHVCEPCSRDLPDRYSLITD